MRSKPGLETNRRAIGIIILSMRMTLVSNLSRTYCIAHNIEMHARRRVEIPDERVIVHRAVRDGANHIRTRESICR
jgi:hypothetical protein